MAILSYITIAIGMLLYLLFSKIAKTNVEESGTVLSFSFIFLTIGLLTNIVAQDIWWITLFFTSIVIGMTFMTGIYIAFVIEYKEEYISKTAKKLKNQKMKK